MTTSTSWRDWSCQVRVTVADGDAEVLATAARVTRAVMGEVSRSCDRFRADSDLSRVNAATGRTVPVRALTLQLVEVALDAARRTGGAVDPTVGSHLLDAGYVDDLDRVRARPAVAMSRSSRRSDWQSVVVDRDLGLVGVPAGLRLDLGATAKAWTADEAARRVRATLGSAVLVEIGGDLAVAGLPGRPWRVDVAEVAGGPAERIDLTHGGLATSSVLARTWRSNRGSEHHIIDPRTSRPTTGDLRTATVWAPSAVVANTWSTAALVWGNRAGARLRDGGVDARLVDRSGRTRTVGAWPQDGRSAA